MNDKEENFENYNVIPNAINDFSKQIVLSVYKDICRLREFERTLIEVIKKQGSNVVSRVHLSRGQETVGIALAHIFPKETYFITHRCTELFIALGTPLELIRDEILCLDTGGSKGKAGSLFSYVDKNIRVHSHTGFIGEQIPIAVGYALGCNKKTICVTGDGGAEEDYALQAYGFAVTHKLPIIFVCNDNNLSIESEVKVRRAWSLTNLARSFGMKAIDVTDDPFTLMKIFSNLDNDLPVFINVRVNREYCHSGIEKTREPRWDRFSIVKQQLINLGYAKEMHKIESNSIIEMKTLWKNYL